MAARLAAFACVTISLAVIVVLGVGAPGQAQDKPYQVLLLNSYHQGLEWTDQVVDAVTGVFAAEKLPVDLRIENMDAKRICDEAWLRVLFDLYKAKYQAARFDLILCSDNVAFEFLLRYRDALFPGVPVVFCGVNFYQDSQIAGHSGFTGVAEFFDVKGTLDAARKLFPGLDRFFIVHDQTETGRAWADSIRAQVKGTPYEALISYSPDMTMDETRGRLANLPENEAAILTVFFRDKSGKYYAPAEATAIFSEASPRPLFGMLDFQLGQGIVGGKLISGYSQGEGAARLGARILRGEKADDVPVVKSGSDRLMFDYFQLERFGVDEASLPPGSEVVNQPRTFYREHMALVWTVTLFIGLQTLTIVFLLVNISRRRRAEADYRGIFENALNGIVLNSPDGRVLKVNDSVVDMFGYASQEEILEAITNVEQAYVDSADRKRFYELLRRNGEVLGFEVRFRRKDGGAFTASVNSRAVRDEHGRLLRVESVLADITERKRAEEEILRAKNEAESASRMKTALLSSVSHELKTPLTSILGFMRIVKNKMEQRIIPALPKDDEALQKVVGQIEGNCAVIINEGQRLAGLIDALLDLLNLTSGAAPLVFSRTAPGDVLRAALDGALADARAKGIELVSDISPDVPDVRGDPVRLRQAAGALLSNAVKFSAGTEVVCGARSMAGDVVIFVRDFGEGIPAEHREGIFERFSQLGDFMTGKPGGLGLGLAVCKEIVTAHGGRIWVESDPGQGSAFYFTIPVWDDNSPEPA